MLSWDAKHASRQACNYNSQSPPAFGKGMTTTEEEETCLEDFCAKSTEHKKREKEQQKKRGRGPRRSKCPNSCMEKNFLSYSSTGPKFT